MAEKIEKPAEEVLSPDTKMWAMLCHLAALALIVFPLFGNVIGPLVVWILKKEDHPFIDENGKESLNFQISMAIYFCAAALLVFIAIGILLLPALGLFWLILTVVAAVKANSGETYKYPLTIRFFK
jgi:uncharacterized Tic20 family protein